MMKTLKLLVLVVAALSMSAFILMEANLLDLPFEPFNYSNLMLPQHFQRMGLNQWDNTPANNITTNDGATLGRVLFYDKKLSLNNTIACASCHIQKFGFSDTARFSKGFLGGVTDRNSMSILEVKYYRNGRFFWDERAATLEAQALMPIQHPVEMGMTLNGLVQKLDTIYYYKELFTRAFGSPEVTSDKISKALAQFMRSIISYRSKFDIGIAQTGSIQPDFPNFTPQENQGKRVFLNPANTCGACHLKNFNPNERNEAVFINDRPTNNGLFQNYADNGLGKVSGNPTQNGLFKVPSLRNIMLTAPYMHDGSKATMNDVLNHYTNGIQNHPNLDNILKNPQGLPRQIPITPQDRQALIAFFHTLTDTALANDVRYSNPFRESVPEYFLAPIPVFDFTLFPNPLPYNGQLHAQFQNINSGMVTVSFLHTNGVLINTTDYMITNGKIDFPYNMIGCGTFLVTIKNMTTNEVATKILVIN